MIWLLGIGLALVISLYLIAPFIARDVIITPSNEISAYRDELRALEQSGVPADVETARLQARLLKAAKSDGPMIGTRSIALPMLICVSIMGSSLGLYAKLGSPNFEPQTPQQTTVGATDFNALLPRFESQLAENPEDLKAWYLYGRTLMLAGQSEAGLRAYTRAMALSDDPDIRKEYEAAKTFAEQIQNQPVTSRGPNLEDITAIQSLSEVDQQTMIKGMVESLRARLQDAPNDPAGWERLLSSRKVLGQSSLAREDIEALRLALPDKAEAIIAKTGWTE